MALGLGSRGLVLILLAVILLVALPSPWNLIAFVVLLPLWIVELLGWNHTMKRRRRVVGAQTLIDRDAVVINSCRPRGQVRLDGEIWDARCDAGASVGDGVRVTGRDGLTLIVEPAALTSDASNGGGHRSQ